MQHQQNESSGRASAQSGERTRRTWLITGISSGFGRAMAELLLARGDAVVGSVRRPESVADLAAAHPDALEVHVADVRRREDVRALVEAAFANGRRIDVVASNAGYGLFGAAEELSDEEVDDIILTNLRGSIDLIRFALPHLRAQQGGRIIQMSTYGGMVAYPGNSMYHATKWGIEGFVESVGQEVAPFGIGVTLVEPGGARTDFRYRSAHVAKLNPAYDGNPAHAFLSMLDKKNGLAPGDPVKMAERIIESADVEPAPLRIVLGSQALKATIGAVEKRLDAFRTPEMAAIARSTDIGAEG